MKSNSNTLESVSALIKELALSFKEEMKVSRAEAEKRNAEYDALMKASNEKYEKSRVEFIEEMKASRAEFDRRIQKLEETTGGISANHGFFAEEYFFNSFEKGEQDFFGEKFDSIERNVKRPKPVIQDEYDCLFVFVCPNTVLVFVFDALLLLLMCAFCRYRFSL